MGRVSVSESETITERKFSLGKTLLAGGIPMTRKVTRQKEVTSEERRKYLYLYAANQPPLVCGQHLLDYEGLGPAMQMTQEANFTFLLKELRQRCQQALFDERLLNRALLTRLLGPAGNTADEFELAIEILAHTLRNKSQ